MSISNKEEGVKIRRFFLAVGVVVLLIASVYWPTIGIERSTQDYIRSDQDESINEKLNFQASKDTEIESKEKTEDTSISFDGNGTKEAPYLIEDIYDLQNITECIDAHYRLANDINASETEEWNDGRGFQPIWVFNGSLDGNGYAIEDLFIERYRMHGLLLGMFGRILENATVKNLTLVDVDIQGSGREGVTVGSITAQNYGTIKNSTVIGNVTGEVALGPSNTGGIAGVNHGSITDSNFTGIISGDSIIGGLAGINEGSILDSQASGNVTGRSTIGGLVGRNNGVLSDSYYTGNVWGESRVGGIVGDIGQSAVLDAHYNIDRVLINGEFRVTIGGVFEEQYKDWIEDKELDIEDYNDSLVPVGGHYEINDIQGIRDLLGFAGDGEKFRLADDIELSEKPGLHIPYFKGEFDGNDHKISGLDLNQSFAAQLGLFGYIYEGVIQNVNLLEAEVLGDENVGSLVGINYEGTVTDSYVEGDVNGSESTGLLVGMNIGSVKRSVVKGDVSGEDGYYYLGGLAGTNHGYIEGCQTSVDVIGEITDRVSGEQTVGGLVGRNTGKIEDSHTSGAISGSSLIGGLVGRNDGGDIVSSHSIANVTGENRIGGLAGDNQGGSILNSYSTGRVNGFESNVGGLVGRNAASSEGPGVIERSYTTSKVMARDAGNVGGLVGLNMWHYTIYVNNSYAIGEVRGRSHVGGLIGYHTGQVKNSYSAVDVSGDVYVGTFVGLNNGQVRDCFSLEGSPDMIGNDVSEDLVGRVTEAPEDHLKDIRLYTKENFDTYDRLEEPWDFIEDPFDDDGEEDIWNIDAYQDVNYGYPFLDWQDVELDKFELTVDSTEGGEVVDPGENTFEYEQWSEVELEAVAEEGYRFVEWTGDHESEEKEISIIMDEDKSVTAHFEVEEYTLTVNTEGEGEVEIEPEKAEYEHGEEVALTAVPDEGWEFEEWTGDVPEDEEGNEITITMDEDKEITAVFEEEEERHVIDEIRNVPGFTSKFLLLALIINFGIYHMKKTSNSRKN